MAGQPSFVELGVHDPERAREFYGKLFGWDFRMLSRGAVVDMSGANGGMHIEDTDPPQFYVYFAVDNLEEGIERVKELGGRVAPLRPASPDLGRFAQCFDDQGIPFGLHERPKPTA